MILLAAHRLRDVVYPQMAQANERLAGMVDGRAQRTAKLHFAPPNESLNYGAKCNFAFLISPECLPVGQHRSRTGPGTAAAGRDG